MYSLNYVNCHTLVERFVGADIWSSLIQSGAARPILVLPSIRLNPVGIAMLACATIPYLRSTGVLVGFVRIPVCLLGPVCYGMLGVVLNRLPHD